MPAKSTFIQRFGLFSPILEKQIADLINKSKAPRPHDFHIHTYKTIYQQGSCLNRYLKEILGRINAEDLETFQQKGFTAFTNFEFWQRFERYGVLSQRDNHLITAKAKIHLSLLVRWFN